MMKLTRIFTACCTGVVALGLPGCVLDTDPVPEMPYRPRREAPAPPQPAPTEEQPVQTTTWEQAPAASSFISAPAAPTSPPPAAAPAPAPVIAPQPVPKPATTVTPAPVPAPVTTPVPAEVQPTAQNVQPTVINLTPPQQPPAATTPTTPSAPNTDLKQITNTGPIPTAARVEGDPTRVWNPLDPSKKIRIINPKTNQPYPSGKKLKVRGTNFQFYVP